MAKQAIPPRQHAINPKKLPSVSESLEMLCTHRSHRCSQCGRHIVSVRPA